MNYELVYSPESLEDLDRIWAEVWIASGNVNTADNYIKGLQASISSKKKYPKTGRPLSYMGEFTGIYMVSYKAYIAFYRIRGSFVEVARFLYSKSDYLKTLFGRSEFIPLDLDAYE